MKEENVLVSIIVPVYNVEQWAEQKELLSEFGLQCREEIKRRCNPEGYTKYWE